MASVTTVIPYAPSVTPEYMLNEAVKSVEDQDVDTELILIKDTEENGPAWARNQGLNQAETRYVAFLDADDLWKEKKLSRQLTRMRETNAGLCVEGEQKSTGEFIDGIITGDIVSRTSSIMIDTHRVTTRFNETLNRFEDHTFMIQAAIESDICFCENIVEIRKHGDGLSARGDAELLHQERKKMVDILQKDDNFPVDKARNFRRRLHYTACVRFRKEEDFQRAVLACFRSFRYGLSVNNLRAAGALPVFFIVYIISFAAGKLRKN